MVCEDCKNQIVDFQVFSENAKKNASLVSDTEIIDEVLKFIDESYDGNLTVKRQDDGLLIAPAPQHELGVKSEVEEGFPAFQAQNNELDFTSEEVMAVEYTEAEDYWIDQEVDETEIMPEDDTTTPNAIAWACKYCGDAESSERFSDGDEFKRHLMEYHRLGEDDSLINQALETVKKPESRGQKRKIVTLSPTGQKQRRLSCSDCGYNFNIESHYRAHNNGHKLFEIVAKVTEFPVCVECNHMFTDEDAVAMHQHLGHDLVPAQGNFLKIGVMQDKFIVPCVEDAVISCGHCGQGFENVHLCRVHQFLHHVGTLRCPFENREFINNQAFSVHLKYNHPEIFEDETIYQCKTCDENFDNLYDKLKHMKTCDKRKFNCNHCDKKFRLRCLLRAHLDQVNGVTQMICTICNKNFPNKNDLGIHMRSHSNDKPFKCSMCPKAYKTSSARASHQETHNENGYTCEICKSKFKARRIMLRHMKTKHSNVL